MDLISSLRYAAQKKKEAEEAAAAEDAAAEAGADDPDKRVAPADASEDGDA